MKPKKCKLCKNEFMPRLPIQPYCGPGCALEVVYKAKRKKLEQAKKEYSKETRRRKNKLKTRADYIKDLQVVFNTYIRTRDHDKPCISCGCASVSDHLTGGSWDCGHYRSVGSTPELRFEPLNAHKQCKKCNRDLSGNIVEYRGKLIDRIGQSSLDWVEGPHKPLKLTIDDAKELIKTYRIKIKELK